MKRIAFIATILILPFSLTPWAFAQGGFTVVSAKAAGSGCKAGNVDINISNDGKQLMIGGGSFEAAIGPGYHPRFSRAQCQYVVTLSHPSNKSFKPGELNIRYNAELDSLLKSEIRTKAYFQGKQKESKEFFRM